MPKVITGERPTETQMDAHAAAVRAMKKREQQGVLRAQPPSPPSALVSTPAVVAEARRVLATGHRPKQPEQPNAERSASYYPPGTVRPGSDAAMRRGKQVLGVMFTATPEPAHPAQALIWSHADIIETVGSGKSLSMVTPPTRFPASSKHFPALLCTALASPYAFAGNPRLHKLAGLDALSPNLLTPPDALP